MDLEETIEKLRGGSSASKCWSLWPLAIDAMHGRTGPGRDTYHFYPYLGTPPNTLPTTRKRLAGVIKARLDKSITGEDIEAVVQAMIDDGLAVIDGTKVSFPAIVKAGKS